MSAQPPPKRSTARKKRGYDPTSGLPRHILETIPPPILEGSERDIVPKDLVYIGSYNWVNSSYPTIVVPGSPRIWAEKPVSGMRVPCDSKKSRVDKDNHRMKLFPLLPLIRAVQDLVDQGVTPKFDWPSVDFVASRSRLRMLLNWANNVSDLWRIDTQLAGEKTVILSDCIGIRQHQSNSFGSHFEDASTYPAPGAENETGHYRIVAYDFDGLAMVVRSEVDACLPYDVTSSTSPSNYPAVGGTVTKKETLGPPPNPSDVKIIRGGSAHVPQNSLLEIKTKGRSSDRMRWQNVYSQLYFSQTQHLYCAVHENGEFKSVDKFELGKDRLVGTDKRAQDGIKKLRKLLGHIKSLVLKHGATRISLVCVGKTLSVYRMREGQSCLPEDVLALFVA